MVKSKWFAGTCVLALACALLVPTIASAQSIAVTRANMELGYDNADVAAGNAITPTSDFDGNGVIERDEMGCFGELYEGGMLTAGQTAIFDANADLINSVDGVIEAVVPGFDIFAGYLVTLTCDGEGSATDNATDTVDGFSAAVGAGTPVATAGGLQPLGCDCSEAANLETAVFDCLGISGQVVNVVGPTELLLGLGTGTYTATTIDTMDPMFTETHTFTSSDTNVFTITSAGVATAVAAGTADVIATGDTSSAVGTFTITVRTPLWYEACTLYEDTFNAQFAGLMGVVGCFLSSPNGVAADGVTNSAANADLDGDGVIDLNQLAALAYTLCDGSRGPDGVAADAVHAANLSAIADLLTFYADATLFMNGAAVTSVTLTSTPASISVNTGAPVQAVSVATTNQAAVNITGAPATFVWTTSNAAVATVAATGGTAGVSATADVTIVGGEGSATITAFDNTNFGATTTITVAVDNTATNNVAVSGDGDVNPGDVTTFTAVTTGPATGETYTWASLTPAVATVNATTGQITAVAEGSASITATGNTSSAVGAKTINVHSGLVCDTATKADESKVAKTTQTSGFIGHLNKILAIWGTATSGGARAELTALGGGAYVTGLAPAFGGIAALTPAAVGVVTLTGTLDDLSAVDDVSAGQAGLSTEYRTATTKALNGIQFLGAAAASFDLDDYFSSTPAKAANRAATVGAIAAINTTLNGPTAPANAEPTLTGGMDWSVLGAAADRLDALEAELALALADIAAGAGVDFPTPPFQVFDYSKLPGEPFDGDSVFAPGVNPSDLTNLEAADLVEAAGGDVYDFVNLITGLYLFGPGSPFLPAAGALGVGLLVGGLALAGIRRMKK